MLMDSRRCYLGVGGGRWSQLMRGCAPLRFKVLLDLRGIPAHLWGVETAQCVVRSSSLITQVAPASISRRDMRTFTVVAWCIDLDLIPDQVVLVVPETEAPYVEQGLFLRPEELIHSSQGTLRYRVQIDIRETQDWRPSSSSGDDDGRPDGDERGGNDDDSSSDDMSDLGDQAGRSRHPLSRRYRFSDPEERDGRDSWPTAKGGDSAVG
jgi:hypothetical protein